MSKVNINILIAVCVSFLAFSAPAAAQIFSDAQGWGYPWCYETIQTADIDGDGADELLGRGWAGIETYDFNAGGNPWEPLPVTNAVWPDAYGWANPQYYMTIQTADVDGDGDDELLGRGGYGIETFDFNASTNSWEPLELYNPPWE
jgi:hypothetical protein